MRKNSLFFGSIYASYKHCDCGGTYHREPHPNYGILAPFCEDCGEIAAKFELVVKYQKIPQRISYDRTGVDFRSMDQLIENSQRIHREIHNGTFERENYRKRHRAGTIGETIDSFINRVVLKQYPEQDANPDYRYLKEYMAPHFADVGIFAACDVHLQLYFHEKRILKNHQREYVKKLWNKVMENARPIISGQVA